MDRIALILAAGFGRRMKSDLPKVLHKINNKTFIEKVLEEVIKADIKKIIIVVGYKKERVIEYVEKWIQKYHNVTIYFAIQKEQKGTGNAVLSAKECFEKISSKETYIMILPGDIPLIQSETIYNAIEYANHHRVACSVLTTIIKNPTGYGRIIRNSSDNIQKIVEEKDTTIQEKSILEINTGILVFQGEKLFHYISKIQCNNAQKEYYLTDMIEILLNHKEKVRAHLNKQYSQFLGVNDVKQLQHVEAVQKQTIQKEI